MSFRDFNRRTAPRKVYTGGMSFRDMKDIPESAAESEPLPEVTEKPPVSQNVITNVPPRQNNVVYSQTIQPNISVQAGYTNLSRYPKSVYIQQPPPVRNPSIPQSVHLRQPQSQFIYYNQSPAPPPAQPTQNFIPPQQPETPDQSKFVEEYVPTHVSYTHL
ncbi:MAG: hypothetical protein K2J40_00725, partial [Ruminococcus sp.]|nr:hypothetical protein [Ruminococcus sp.]